MPEQQSAVGLYHRVTAAEDFDAAARTLLGILQKAARDFPGRPRYLYLDIDGHRNAVGGVDDEMLELQHFVTEFLSPWLASYSVPPARVEPAEKPQREDVPETLTVRRPRTR